MWSLYSVVGRNLEPYQEHNSGKKKKKRKEDIADISLICFQYRMWQETISVVLYKNLLSNFYSADTYQNMDLTLFCSSGILINPCSANI